MNLLDKLFKKFQGFLKIASLRKYKTLVLALGIVLLGILVYLFKSAFVAAIVNGNPISRLALTKELENQSGRQVLDSLVSKVLILQEAKKLGIKIDDSVVQKELTNIDDSLKKQGTDLNTALKQRGQTKESLIEQIRIQKMIEAILGQKINITDEDLKTYFETNKDLFAKGATLESVKEQIRQQVFQNKLMTEYQKWMTDLRNKAKVYYFVNF